jgi:Asp-tRNA(Asn)/Glu-tRNA(Gln) amidotransferase B subunit
MKRMQTIEKVEMADMLTAIGRGRKSSREAKKYLERVRLRTSYRTFQQLLKYLNTDPDKKAILQAVYNILDQHRAFGSATNSEYAQESLELLLKDSGVLQKP